jgi:predicted permease
MMAFWPNEVRHAVRALRRSPTFALTVVLTLTVTLGINVGVFSTLNALALRRLPAPRPDELVRLSTAFRTGQEVPFSFPMFRELARRQNAVSSLIGWTGPYRHVEAQGVTTMGGVTAVTGNYFAELGAVPAAGRLLLPSDVDLEAFTPAAVAVIGHGFWQRRFGGSPAALGATVRIDDVPLTIVGVAPRGFKGFGLMAEPDVIVPLTTPGGVGAPANYANAGLLWMRVAGRLAPGTSLDETRVQLETVWPSIKADIIPPTHAGAQRDNFLGLPLRLESLARGHEPYLQDFRIRVIALQGLALLAFLVGCLNLASLTLRRLAAGVSEQAIRLALGASSWQAVRHVLFESVFLVFAAIVCAVPIGVWASAAITQMILPSGSFALTLNTNPDARVFAFAIALTVGASLLFGGLPAWRSARNDVHAALHFRTRAATASRRTLRMMVVAQLAVSVVLLTNVGLLVRSLQRVLTVDLGFDATELTRATFTTRPGVKRRPDDAVYFPALIERIEALPETGSAAIALTAPGSPGFPWMISPMSWEPTDGISAVFNSVTPGFFETLQIPVLVGRDFRWSDDGRAPPVAVVTRSLAARMFPDRDPIGQRIRIGTQPYRQNLEVVGVVADAKVYDVKDELSYAAYIADLQNSEPSAGGTLIIRGRVQESAVQQAVTSVGPDFLLQFERITEAFAAAVKLDRLTALLAGIFAGATLLLAVIGVGGLFAYTVVLRRKEIAIRLALGGEPQRIVNAIVREGLLVAAVGAGVGAILGQMSTRPVQPLLFQIEPSDPVVMITVPLVLAAVAVVACLAPAWRAAHVNPVAGLRVE